MNLRVRGVVVRWLLITRSLSAFAPPGIDLDVGRVALRGDELPHVLGIVGFVGTQVLLLVRRTLEDDRRYQIDGGYLIVAVGARERDRDGSAAPIHQMMS